MACPKRCVLITLLLGTVLHAEVRYVDPTSSGGADGSSWADAFTELQAALDVAVPGDELWVAAGVFTADYDPRMGSHTGDRGAAFNLVDGVGIYGGFAGNEVGRGERETGGFMTVLSGDLLGNDGPDFSGMEDNSYHVVVASGTGPTTVLDGVIIRGGHANGTGTDEVGAGIYNIGGSPTITDCTISGNVAAFQGGGMQNKDGANPTMIGCVFSGNHAGDNGGAMYNGDSSPQLIACSMVDNTADLYAGGVCNRDLSDALFDGCTFARNIAGVPFPQGGGGGAMVNARSHPTIIDCVFTENANVSGNGGAIVNEAGFDKALGGSNPQIIDTQFIGNTGFFWGAAIYSKDDSHPMISGCAFTANTTIYCGGAIYAADSTLTVDDTTFEDNSTVVALFTNGGALYTIDSNVTVTDSRFTGNSTALAGGGMYSDGGQVVLDRSIFEDNHAAGGDGVGGGVYMVRGDLQATGCVFEGNSGLYGGGLYNLEGTAVVRNSAFVLNEAGIAGGGMSNTTTAIDVDHCTFYGNSATNSAGGVYNFSGTNMDMTGSILWGNTSDMTTLELAQINTVVAPDTTLTVSYSNIEGLDALVGPGNIDVDPQFIDAVNGDVHLPESSPCVDAGDPAVRDEGDADFDGQPRLVGIIDIGADEVHDCNDNDVLDHVELQDDPDCNTNFVLDGCDIASGTSADDDRDGIPDECATACATLADCADLDGNGIRDDGCVWWACTDGACAGTDVVFADMGGQFGACPPDATADGNDRFHALNCFANARPDGTGSYQCEAAPPAALNVDTGGQFGSCTPDGVCDGNDAFAALNAFAGTSTCSCPLDGVPEPESSNKTTRVRRRQ